MKLIPLLAALAVACLPAALAAQQTTPRHRDHRRA